MMNRFQNVFVKTDHECNCTELWFKDYNFINLRYWYIAYDTPLPACAGDILNCSANLEVTVAHIRIIYQ